MPSKHSPYGRGSRAKSCRECGALAADGAQISSRALCRDCAIDRVMIPANELVAREGPVYETWKRAMVEHAQRLITS